MAVPYHTHTFEIPAATKAEVEAGTRDDVAATPAALGSAATKDVSYFATSSQGGKADTAVQNINGKSGTSVTLTKDDIGLSNVDNTADANKPVSSPTQTALNLKANSADLGSAAYTAATSYATADQGSKADSAVQTINGKSGTSVTLVKADVGLSNVDNTSDLNKPISTATQTALNGKATTAQGVKADSALQALGGSAGQVLVKISNTDNDVEWETVAAATAVSYAAQTLTTAQQGQARDNIGAFSSSGGTISGDTTVDGSLTAGASNVEIIRIGPEAGNNIVISSNASIMVNNGAPSMTWPINIAGNAHNANLIHGNQIRAGSAVVTTNVSGDSTITYPAFPIGAICAVASHGDLIGLNVDAQTTGAPNGAFNVRVTRTTDGSAVTNSAVRINYMVIGS